ncbi:MAG: hypothetical protein J6A38_00190 [Clostridia bacterium]|nr:hypothetical protein [Clostridia bacterium]
MGVDKIIWRAILSTLAAVVLLIMFLFVALVCFYPSTMMELTYKLGMDKQSIRFAERAYKRSDDVYYIAYATEVAIGIESYEKIDVCGEKFISDTEFEEYCLSENPTYKQYVYGQVCVAKYEREQKDEAVERAFELLEEGAFPKNNAVVAVLLTALSENDGQTVAKIQIKMTELQGKISPTDKPYFDEILAFCNG